jgi:predicted PurR-regulated permease PerM
MDNLLDNARRLTRLAQLAEQRAAGLLVMFLAGLGGYCLWVLWRYADRIVPVIYASPVLMAVVIVAVLIAVVALAINAQVQRAQQAMEDRVSSQEARLLEAEQRATLAEREKVELVQEVTWLRRRVNYLELCLVASGTMSPFDSDFQRGDFGPPSPSSSKKRPG